MTVSQVVMAQTEDKKEILILSSFSFYALFSYFWKINCKIPGKITNNSSYFILLTGAEYV